MMVAIGLLAAASVASADDSITEEEAPVDLINFGYDEENHVFIVHTSTTDSTYDCELPAHALMVGYGAVEGGSYSVDGLEDENGIVEFDVRPGDEDSEEAAGDPLAYAPDGECALSGYSVGGPNGQINHGQFMKLFHQVVGKQANGCLNRIIAQSDLGKGDQQVRTSDIEDALESDEGSEATDAIESGTVEFESFVAVCEKGKKDKNDDHPSNNKDKAKKDKSDRSRGNSNNAPGRNN
jgi:hypothetical protein